jgi:signal transduction histidine kinase
MEELHGLKVVVEADHAFYLSDQSLQIQLFQIVRELLFNVKKHAGRNQAVVKLTETAEHFVIHVIDEGNGFNVAEVKAGREQQGGFGLFSIQERMNLLDGRLEINARPGEGTHIKVHVPVVTEQLQP